MVEHTEGYTIVYRISDAPIHAWKSLSLTVQLKTAYETKGNRFGFMQALKRFHEIMEQKKIDQYHIVSVQCHSIGWEENKKEKLVSMAEIEPHKQYDLFKKLH